MNVLVILVPCSVFLGIAALIGFLWTIKSRQYDDLEGDATRILIDDEDR